MAETQFEFIDEDKELSGGSYEDAEQTETGLEASEESPQQAVAPESDTADDSGDTEGTDVAAIKVGEEEFSSVEDLVDAYGKTKKSYTEYRSLNDRQTNELGELRKTVEQVRDNQPKVETPMPAVPAFDAYDPDTVKANVEQWATERWTKLDKKRRTDETQTKIKSAYSSMLGKFSKDHPDLSRDEMMDVAKFADKRGITFIEDAYSVMNMRDNTRKAEEKGATEVAKKLKSATNVPQTLSSVGGSPSQTAPDIDRLSERDWSRLSSDERWKHLENSPLGV